MKALTANNLSKTYNGNVHALKDLNLEVEKGEIFGLFGPNGSGKTTTVRLFNGILTPSCGVIKVLDFPAGDDRIRYKIATLSEDAKMYEHMSILDNLFFFSQLYDMPARVAKDRIMSLLERMTLLKRENDKLGTFSTGMKKKVYLIRTLLHNPEIIFLDEPTSGLDPDAAADTLDLICQLAKEEQTTIFLCTHNLTYAESICDKLGFIKQGKLIASGRKEEMLHSIFKDKKVIIKTTTNEYTYTFIDEGEINGHLRRLMDNNEGILDVTINTPTMEDLYFYYIGRERENKKSATNNKKGLKNEI